MSDWKFKRKGSRSAEIKIVFVILLFLRIYTVFYLLQTVAGAIGTAVVDANPIDLPQKRLKINCMDGALAL